MVHQEDIKLVKRLLTRDEAAFEQFFNGYFPRLYRFALTRIKDDDEVIKDIIQSTLANAIRGLRSYRGEASLFTWMCQICRNEINGYFRKQGQAPPLTADEQSEIEEVLALLEAPESDEPVAIAERGETRDLVQIALDHLPANYASALEWKYLDGFSVQEIAAKLGVGTVAAQSILARARSAFREAVSSISTLHKLSERSHQG